MRVNFSETAKEVKADTTFEIVGSEGIQQEDVIKEATKLFDLAKKEADDRTAKKIKGV